MFVPPLGELHSFWGALLISVFFMEAAVVSYIPSDNCKGPRDLTQKSHMKGIGMRRDRRRGTHLIATFLRTQLAQRHLRLHAAHGTLLVREPI